MYFVLSGAFFNQIFVFDRTKWKQAHTQLLLMACYALCYCFFCGFQKWVAFFFKKSNWVGAKEAVALSITICLTKRI